MKMITFHEEASFELGEAAQYYEDRAAGLGLAFLAEIEEFVKQVLANPEACQHECGEIRCKRLRHFPYNLFYSLEAGNCSGVSILTLKSNETHTEGTRQLAN